MRKYREPTTQPEPEKVYLNRKRTRWTHRPNKFEQVEVILPSGEIALTTRRPDFYQEIEGCGILCRVTYRGERHWAVPVREGKEND